MSFHGYSSWAPSVAYKFYRNSVESGAIPEADQLVIFLMSNDALPAFADESDQYYMSNATCQTPRETTSRRFCRDSTA